MNITRLQGRSCLSRFFKKYFDSPVEIIAAQGSGSLSYFYFNLQSLQEPEYGDRFQEVAEFHQS